MCYKLTSHNARYRLLHYPDYYMYSIDLQRIILYSNNPYLQFHDLTTTVCILQLSFTGAVKKSLILWIILAGSDKNVKL